MNQISPVNVTSAEAPVNVAELDETTTQETEGAQPEASMEVTTSEVVEMEPIEAFASVDLPINALLGALSCASKEETRYYLNGVFVHRVEDRVRMVATDGHRMFIASYQPTLCGTGEDDTPDFPSWLDDGIILSSDRLAPKLSMAAKLTDNPCARLSYAKGASVAFLSDKDDEATFKVRPVDGTFPDYQHLLGTLTGGVSEESDLARRDFEPVSFNGTYLKGVGDLSKILVGKDAAVSVYASAKSEATIITFPGAPGTMLVLMPMKTTGPIHQETVSLMAPAVKGTLAALRAHLTRNQQAAEQATDPVEKARYLDKANEYERRIADVLNKTFEQPALPAPEALAEGEAESGELADGQPLGTEQTESEETETETTGDEPKAEETVTEEAPQASEEQPTEPQETSQEQEPEVTADNSDAAAEAPHADAKPVSRKDRRAQRRAQKAA